jgi:hypothetical protein
MFDWFGRVIEAARVAKAMAAVTVAVWFLVPFAVRMVLHPSDVIRLQYWLQGQPVPGVFSQQMLTAGVITALVGLVVLAVLLQFALLLLYRSTQFAVALWPVAGLLVGVIGNGWWWHRVGFFDSPGALAGLASLALTVIAHAVFEKWGEDFVFGAGNRPHGYRG